MDVIVTLPLRHYLINQKVEFFLNIKNKYGNKWDFLLNLGLSNLIDNILIIRMVKALCYMDDHHVFVSWASRDWWQSNCLVLHHILQYSSNCRLHHFFVPIHYFICILMTTMWVLKNLDVNKVALEYVEMFLFYAKITQAWMHMRHQCWDANAWGGMKAIGADALHKHVSLNSLTKLWRTLSMLMVLWSNFPKWFKMVELLSKYWASIEDGRCFSLISFSNS